MAHRRRFRLLRTLARADLGGARNLAIGCFRHGLHFRGGHGARNHEDRVIGRVETLVERQRILARELFDLVFPADDRTPVGMIEIERGGNLLTQPGLRAVGDAHVELFQHDVTFRQNIFVGQHEAGHTVGFKRHHQRQMFLGDPLEIAGVVGCGEGVFLSADCRKHLGEFSRRVFLGALEHQVFKKMRDAGGARRLVG